MARTSSASATKVFVSWQMPCSPASSTFRLLACDGGATGTIEADEADDGGLSTESRIKMGSVPPAELSVAWKPSVNSSGIRAAGSPAARSVCDGTLSSMMACGTELCGADEIGTRNSPDLRPRGPMEISSEKEVGHHVVLQYQIPVEPLLMNRQERAKGVKHPT